MALRVLLADNSETIRKVMQLSLQDYAVDVKSVNLGVDVLHVAKSFQPDIVFIDILLQKKNGYEVAQELKADPQLKKVPIVIMWSGFMDFDPQKARSAGSDAELEKPFDSEAIRTLVQKLVPKTKQQGLSEHMSLPPLPNWSEAPPKVKTEPVPQKPPTTLPDFEAPGTDVDDFSQVPLQQAAKTLPQPSTANTNNFVIDVPDEADFDRVTVNYTLPTEEITTTDFLLKPGAKSSPPAVAPAIPTPPPLAPAPSAVTTPQNAKAPSLSEEQILEVVRAEAREIIEKIAWKLIPDMASQMIREEIKRLLDDTEAKLP